MKEFFIDFCSYVAIKAENELDARRKFWKWIEELQDKEILGIAEIDGVEENLNFKEK